MTPAETRYYKNAMVPYVVTFKAAGPRGRKVTQWIRFAPKVWDLAGVRVAVEGVLYEEFPSKGAAEKAISTLEIRPATPEEDPR